MTLHMKMKPVVKKMRPRYLEIEGLQSFKTLQKIDFDKLSETGLFGIFGSTGSGKSTILDAITLALYGNVHRAAKGTQGIINTDMGGTKVVFIFDLTKEGSRKTYRVERLYKRKKDSESSAEAKITRLFEITEAGEIILADKHSDVNNCIIQLIGLKFEDFTRSVVLPQNKFQEFLLSPRGEKTKMLERIFYLEEYGRQLNDKVNKQMTAVKSKLSSLNGAISMLGNASPEALIESERKLKETQALKDKCQEEQKQTELQYTEGSRLYELSKEYLTIQQQLEELKSKQADIENIKEISKRAEAAKDIKALIDTYKEAKTGYEEAMLGLNSTEERLQAIEADKISVQQSYETAQKAKEQKLPELIKYKTILNECQTLDKEAKALEKLLTTARKEYAQIKEQMEQTKNITQEKAILKEGLSSKVKELEKKLEELVVDNEHRRLVSQGVDMEKELISLKQYQKKHREKINEIKANISEYQAKQDVELKAIVQCNDAIAELKKQDNKQEAAKPMDRQQILEQQSKIIKMENLLSNMTNSLKLIKELEGKLISHSKQYDNIRKKIDKLEQELSLSNQHKQEKQGELKQLQQKQSQEVAAILAQSLIHGEECPVCGSKEHPNPALHQAEHDTAKVEKEINELQAQIEAAERTIREQEIELIKQKQQQQSVEESKQQIELDINKYEKEYHNQKQALPETVRQLEYEAIYKYIEAEKQSCESALKSLQEWEQKNQQLKDSIKKQEDSLAEIKVRESRYKALLDSERKALCQEQKQEEEVSHSIEANMERYEAAAKQLGIESFEKEANNISQKDEERQIYEKTIKEHRSSLDACMLKHQELLEEINKINDSLAEKRSEGIKLKEQKDEKDKKIAEILQGKSLDEELSKVDIETEALEIAYKKAYEALNRLNESIAELQKQKSAFQNSYTYFKEKLELSQKQLKNALEAKGFSDIEAVISSLLTEQSIMAYQEEIKKYEREKSSLEDRMQTIAKQLEGRQISSQQWQELCEAYETAKARLVEQIALLEGAKNNYLLIKENFEKWVKLQEELQAIGKKKDMLEQIQRLLKGNAFIEFISEERMRYIAREATETLGQLTKFRYSIELDSDNGFVIRDNANGGVLRSVASLSGGETFLTSLSLALALSSQLQLKGQSPLEFFFLDEGFGTLDNTLLDTVVDSLERLSNSNRIIGLISHVPELKSRISRRLLVEAPDRLGNGSRVIIEKA